MNNLTINHFLSFSLNSEIWAMLPSQQLATIISLDPNTIVPIPDMPAAVVGVFPWQGEVLWLVDLAYLLGFEPLLTPDYHQSKRNVLRVTSLGKTLGLLVHQVGQLIKCKTEEIQLPPTKMITSTTAQYIKGMVRNYQGEALLIVDVEAILETFE
ncbi:MAG: chemotaxis protein CheW [Symploca sp. SIO1B1]|nr:chemotaxis protein CheW [Symploca sp. SIO2D2]NER47318.1 chemotaxis protein CheW [Symploca sp. SIO1A3]NER93701.1 chemotaxis protein CheW [Symploca sp. SIO1B1]